MTSLKVHIKICIFLVTLYRYFTEQIGINPIIYQWYAESALTPFRFLKNLT